MTIKRSSLHLCTLLTVFLFAGSCGKDSSNVAPRSVTKPGAPANLQVTFGDREATLSWDPVAGAATYRIYWNTTGSVTTADSLIDNATSPYTHSPLANGTVYYYAISAVNSAGASPLSSPASVKPLPLRVIECGAETSFLIDSIGRLWAWGYNDVGQLGIGSFSNQYTPEVVSGIGNVVAVNSTRIHTVALTADGSVWTWGENSANQLGDDHATGGRWSPYRVGLTGKAISVAAGHTHTVVAMSDGSVWIWGANSDGQLGLGHKDAARVPAKVPGLSGARAVAAGENCTFALMNDGTIRTWGLNTGGQLGINSADGSTRESPVSVAGTDDAVSVDALRGLTVALRVNHIAIAWGRNDFGQVGNNTTNNVLGPTTVLQLYAPTAITCGIFHAIALQTDRYVYSWGSGALGDTTTTSRNLPEKVMGLSDVVMIAAGTTHNMAVKSDGSVWAWGANLRGQLGDGTSANQTLPSRVPAF